MPDLAFAKPGELADYRPAFSASSVYADARGALWIKTLQPPKSPGTSIYDVVTREGRLIERVEIPNVRTIVGFDATSLYLAARGTGTLSLERVRLP